MSLLEMPNLGEGFKKYFEFLPALTPELRDEVFRIRHNVYCEELKFEPARPDGRETDEYDAHSVHCLIRSVNTGDYVGCIRLVKPRPEDPTYPLPFEKTCAGTLDRSIIDPQGVPRDRIGEVSRLAVIADYRRRKGEQKIFEGLSDRSLGDTQRPRFPYIPIGLYLGTIELARRLGIETLFVLTEPRLAKFFRTVGVKGTQQIGGPVEHRGQRVPSMMDCNAVVDGLNFVLRPLYNVVAAELDKEMRKQTNPQVD